jgi:hypothetical protein
VVSVSSIEHAGEAVAVAEATKPDRQRFARAVAQLTSLEP